MEKENIEKIFDFLHVVSDLKKTKRYGDYDIEGDSGSDHSWRLALMTFIYSDELCLDIDVLKAVKIAIVHDLPEAITGDIDYGEIYKGNISKEEKQKNEIEAINKLKNILPEKIGKEIIELWEEYEYSRSREALFVKALDKIETISYIVEKGKNYSDEDLVATYIDKHVKNFPELKPVLRELKKRLKIEFEKRGIEWKEEYDKYEGEIEEVVIRDINSNKKVETMKQAQELVRQFALRNNWKDVPNIDKIDHLHEELGEMSKYLRYKDEEGRKRIVRERPEVFKDGIGDLFFGTCRLANQLGVDIEDAFNMVQKEILDKYNHKNDEDNIVRE